MPDNTMVDISDLPPSVVFAALYNNAVVKGFEGRTPLDGFMSITAANAILNDRSSASYVKEWGGRIIGVDFTRSKFDPTVYDAANAASVAHGQSAREIVNHIRTVLTREVLDEATKDFWKVDVA